jgi:hypothetical protein
MLFEKNKIILKKGIFFTSAFYCVLLINACASSSFFISYPEQMRAHKINILEGKAESTALKLSEKGSGPNHILDVLESSRIAQLSKNYKLSSKQFKSAFDLFNAEDNKAKLDLSDGGSLLTSFAINDNALPYKPEAYERILAYQYQSINYLSEGDLQGALVEIRRANAEQEYALEAHHKELAKAEKEANEGGIDPGIDNYQDRLKETFTAANKVKNSFQNAYTFYYSGIIRESAGELNGAYIDYKKAFEIYPDNNYLQKDIWRLGQKLSMSSDLDRFSTLIKNENKQAEKTIHEFQDSELGNVVVFYEQGFIPPKEEISLPFASYEKIYAIAFPAYLLPWKPSVPIKLDSDSHYLGHTSEILDLHALAAKALQEGSFKRLLRQMLRVNTKARLQREAINANNGNSSNAAFGQFFASAYSLVSERADLRSWLSLPSKVQTARFSMPAGSQNIHFSNATFSSTINVNIEKGKTTFIRVINPGNQNIYTESFIL